MSVMTIRGPIAADDLGTTLSHEHLLINITNQSSEASMPATCDAGMDRVEKRHLSLLRKNPYLMPDNLCLDSVEDTITEVNEFQKAGGRTIVDCTSSGIGRDPEKLRMIAVATGINIVMGCGYYTYDTHPPALKEWTCEKIRDEIMAALIIGVGNDKIRAGIIGEIGTSKNITTDEFKVMKASALAGVATGAAIQVHTYPWSQNGIDVADFLIKNRMNPDKIVICHTDVTLNKNYIRQVLERGVFVQFDNFGKEFEPDISAVGFAGGSFAKDSERVALIADLMEKGFAKQILITTDICLKCLLKKYGGKGYAHVLTNVADMLEQVGIPWETTRKVLLIENPARLLDK